MNDKTFRILSIDGGGVRGLYASSFLEKLEEHYGKSIADHFDLICGTSTGGLIALALSLGHTAQEISGFYKERGVKIFPNQNKIIRTVANWSKAITNTYNSSILKSQVTDFFGNTTLLEEANTLLCIPSYNISRGMPIVFKSPNNNGDYIRDGKLPVIDVALATASAPTYFKNHYIDHPSLRDTYCTDGGVWANNPSLCGVLEAWSKYVGDDKSYDSITILSVSTAPKPSGKQFKGKGGLLFGWKEDLMGSALSGQSYMADHFIKSVSNKGREISYKRIAPSGLSVDEQKILQMDLASPKAINKLSSLGTECATNFITQEKKWINPIFDTSKSYIINS